MPFFPVTTAGIENLPIKGKPVVYVANHNSFLDIFALSYLEREEGTFLDKTVGLKYLAKSDIFLIPWVGWLMGLVGQISLDRNARKEGKDILCHARAKLQNGVSVVVFPEGTRSRTGQMAPYKVGAFKLAVEEGVSVIPITIKGTHELAGRPVDKTAGGALIGADEMSLGEGEVTVIVHPEISSAGESVETLMRKTRQVIQKELVAPQVCLMTEQGDIDVDLT